MALALRLDGRAIAMKCNLLAGDGAVAFKIAYDESYARFSPGVLLELEHLRRLHEPGAPAWVDSGAAADHPMIGHLWRDRIAVETLVIPIGQRLGELHGRRASPRALDVAGDQEQLASASAEDMTCWFSIRTPRASIATSTSNRFRCAISSRIIRRSRSSAYSSYRDGCRPRWSSTTLATCR